MTAQTQGQQLLAHVASVYRAQPDFWCKGWGRLHGEPIDGEPGPGVIKRLEGCCPEVAIRRFGPQFGGTPAVDEALSIVYKKLSYIRADSDRERLWVYNDATSRTRAQVIELLEECAGIRAASAPLLRALAREITAPNAAANEAAKGSLKMAA